MLLQYNRVVEFKGQNMVKKHVADAGYDVLCPDDLRVGVGESVVVDTGLSVWIPEGLVGLVKSRSGLSLKHGIEVGNGGVVDAGYQGSIKVKVYNFGEDDYELNLGDRFCQIVFVPCGTHVVGGTLPWIVPEVSILDWPTTMRGINGCGSSGR